eukprot:03822_5
MVDSPLQNQIVFVVQQAGTHLDQAGVPACERAECVGPLLLTILGFHIPCCSKTCPRRNLKILSYCSLVGRTCRSNLSDTTKINTFSCLAPQRHHEIN